MKNIASGIAIDPQSLHVPLPINVMYPMGKLIQGCIIQCFNVNTNWPVCQDILNNMLTLAFLKNHGTS